MAEKTVPAGGSSGKPESIFERASSFQWGELTAHVDHELKAIVIGIHFDREGKRGVETLVAPSAALDFALRLVGACERLQQDILSEHLPGAGEDLK